MLFIHNFILLIFVVLEMKILCYFVRYGLVVYGIRLVLL
jgi:hypothetical protein